MHMYTTVIVAKMHKIQFIRKKENIFPREKDSGISENKQFLTVVDEVFLWVSKNLCLKHKTVNYWSTSQAVVTNHLFPTMGAFNKI